MSHDVGNSEEQRLEDLLAQWFEARTKPTARELCWDYPALAEKLESKIRKYRAMEEFRIKDEPEEERSSWPDVPNHQLIELVGRGGMGRVFKARQLSTGRIVAVKLLPAGAGSTELLRRFKQEIELTSRFQHPGIVPIFEAGNARDRQGQVPFYTMEFVDGLPLHRHVEALEPAIPNRVQLLIKICDAVAAVHALGWVHRDLKPSNIIITAGGEPKLLDFGVARAVHAANHQETMHTTTGQFIGTRQYASPEQLRGAADEVDARSDVHALGLIAYEVLAGRRPYEVEGLSIEEAIRTICDSEPPTLSRLNRELRGDLETIVRKALSKDPARRYANAAELRDDLARFQQRARIRARRDSWWYRLRVFSRRNKGVVGAVLGVLLALTAGLALAISQKTRADELARHARLELADQLAASGLAHADEGDPAEGLVDLARAIKIEEEIASDTRRVRDARMRYTTTSGLTPTTMPVDERWLNYANGGLVLDPRIVRTQSINGETIIELRGLSLDPGAAPKFHFNTELFWTEISPDGRRLAVGRLDHRGELYDIDTGALLRSEQFADPVWTATFTPDGQRVVYCDWPGNIQAWSAADGKTLWHRNEKPGLEGITFIATSPDSRKLALICDQGKAAIIDCNGNDLGTIVEVPSRLLCASFDPTGTLLALGDVDGVVRTFDWRSGKQTAPLLRHALPVGRISFRQDALIVATLVGHGYRTSMVQGPAQAWRMNGSSNIRWSYPKGRMTRHLVMCDDGITIGDETGLLRLDVATGEVVGRFTLATSGTNAAWVQGPLLLLTPPATASVTAFSARDGRLLLPAVHPFGSIRSYGVDAEGKRLVILWQRTTSQGGSLFRAWDLASAKPLFEPVEVPGRLGAVAISPHGRFIATSDEDGNSNLWDGQTGSHVRVLPSHRQRAWTPLFSNDETKVLTCSFDGTAQISGTTDSQYRLVIRHRDSVESRAMSKDGRYVATAGQDNCVQLWDMQSREAVCPPLRMPARTAIGGFSDDGNVLAVHCSGLGVRLLSTRNGSSLSPIIPAQGEVTSYFLSHRDQIIIADQEHVSLLDYSPDQRSGNQLCKLQGADRSTAR